MSAAKAQPQNAMDATSFRRALKSGLPAGGYLFVGAEQYLKRYCMEELRKKILPDPGLAVFNHIRLSYPEIDHDGFLQALASPPMMAEYKLIEVHDCPFGALSEKELDDLITDLSLLREYPDTTLVLYAMPEEWDTENNKKFDPLLKRFSEAVTPVLFARETPAKLCKWIRQHFSVQGITIGDDHCELILSLCGRDMDDIATEIDKLAAYLNAREEHTVSEEAIRTVVSSNMEIGAFDFANAILAGQCGKAYSYFASYKQERKPEELILGTIVKVYRDLSLIKVCADSGATQNEIASMTGLNPYVVGRYLPVVRTLTQEILADAIDCCTEADRALKSRTTDGYMILELLIAKVALRRRKAARK